jgi:hypothetical protein
MKTAVEWLIEKHFGSIENCSPNFRKHIEQANKIFEEQVMNARLDGFKISAEGWNGEHPFEGVTDYYIMLDINNDEYYNQTFKSNEHKRQSN